MTQAVFPGAGSPGPSRAGFAACAMLAAVTAAAWAVLVRAELGRAGEAAFARVLCTPLGLEQGAAAELGPLLLLWIAMAAGMMLPSAAPMVLAATERLDRAGARRPVLCILAVVAGYLAVWVAVAIAAALAQAGAARLGALAPLPPRLLVLAAGAAIGAAGLYQFSPVKLAGLAFCRHPLARLDAGAEPPGPALALREGLAQGVACLGCCAAMMAVMALAGLMNLFWMAAFSALVTVEKLVGQAWLARAIGFGLLVAGFALSVSAVGPEAILRWAVSA